ncbi:MAG TPA: Uma2 family endonuclease [Pyrinomonadaceae bacterium]|nr:Uma2 family endonuclease [Pyrinomonadaceae bacterium]
MSATSTALMTAEELMQLPDDDLRHELINGELVTMPVPRLPHGRTEARLGSRLTQFVLDHDLGEVYTNSGFQLTWNPDTVAGPDIAFVSKERLEQAGDVTGYWQGAFDLAVEIYMPGYRPGKVSDRISRLFSAGTKQVWIVHLKHRTVAVYRSESDITTFSGSDYLEAQDLFPGFRISLEKIFGPTPGGVKESK